MFAPTGNRSEWGCANAGTPSLDMPPFTDIRSALNSILQDLLERYDSAVPEHGRFADLRASRSVYYGDPSVTQAGHLELAVMHMDTEIDRNYDQMRFVAVRVWKSRDGGIASSTCFHGLKPEVKASLENELSMPDILAERVEELAHGLPEETNPDIWR